MFSSLKRTLGLGIAVCLICSPLLSQSSPSSPKPSSSKPLGAIDVLSDTRGVNFGPYLKTLIKTVKQNWYQALSKNAVPDKGNVSIEFIILKDGRVTDMHRAEISGNAVLDKGAWDAITASNPLPPLPTEFDGPSLSLRVHFYYNPEHSDALNQK